MLTQSLRASSRHMQLRLRLSRASGAATRRALPTRASAVPPPDSGCDCGCMPLGWPLKSSGGVSLRGRLIGSGVHQRRWAAAAAGDAREGGATLPLAPGTCSRAPAEELVEYLNASWTPFHATVEAAERLKAAGFEQLSERSPWELKPGSRYFYTRNQSAIVAFAIGKDFVPGNGFNIVAAHTDSPCPKLKPISATSRGGFLGVGVQTYGGGLWHTWFDRDLSVAGRVLLRRNTGALEHALVRIDRPIMRIPTLAIHLDRTVNSDGFKPNTETHLAPVLATCIRAELADEENGGAGGEGEEKAAHHMLLLRLLAAELGCAPEEIADFELNVCDTQPGAIAGAEGEFIYSGRLDNLASSFCALKALIEACESEDALEGEKGVRMIGLFDHEEVGSDSTVGAGSPMVGEAIKRVTTSIAGPDGGGEGAYERALRNSFLVSADMAHALHPNYMDRHEENHQPKLHRGLVVKSNANQRYATSAVTAFLFREIARRRGIPMQEFVVRNDMGCGSTIGPILASGLGIRTVDVGCPQLSMHSVREMMGVDDVAIAHEHFKAFFETFSAVDEELTVD